MSKHIGPYLATYIKGENGKIGHYQYNHIIAAEKMIGRKLKNDEEVHHRDSNPANNSPANLQIVVRGKPRDGLKSHSAVDKNLQRGGRHPS